MAYRNNFLVKNDRNRISTLMNRLDQNLLSNLSNINSNYSSNNLLANYKFQNNYSNAADFNNDDGYDEEDFSNFLSESNEDEETKQNAEQQLNLNRKDILVQLDRERKKRKVLENRLKQLQASMMKKQLHDNEKLCKKLSTSLSIQNRRFDGDGSEDDLNPTQKTNIPKNKINYQTATNSYQNNCSNNYRGNYQPAHSNDHHLNDLSEYSTLKAKDIDKIIKIIKQQQEVNKNSLNDDCNSSNSRNSVKNIKNNLIGLSLHEAHAGVSADNQSLNSLLSSDCGPTLLHNDLYVNESNLKRQIINSMKTNFNSMIEFIENQSFSQDNFMAIQQLINLIMMQNCQFMNHQQVLLCWLQKLQLCTSSRSNQTHLNSNHHLTNNQHNTPIDVTNEFTNENHELNSTNHLNNLKLTTTLNNQQIEPAIKATANNYYDNLKSHSMFQNQLGVKMKNSAQNYKLNNKLNKNNSDKQNIGVSNEFKELYSLIEQLIENNKSKQQSATGKMNSYHQEFDEAGAVGGEDPQIGELKLNDLTDNLHQANNLKQVSTQNGTGNLGNNNNLNNNVSCTNHLTNGASSSTVNNTNSTANKSPQMISLHIPPTSNAVRKKTTNPTTNRKNSDAIESISSMQDDLIKNSETTRPFSAAEGRSSDPTSILKNQVKVLNNVNSSKMNPTISSTSSISSSSIVAPATSSNGNNPSSSHSLLLKRATLGGVSRLNNNNFANDDNETETETDDDHHGHNQIHPEINSSENENEVSNSMQSSNQIVESSLIGPDQQIDEQLGFVSSHMNGRNDSEIRLSGDGEQQGL